VGCIKETAPKQRGAQGPQTNSLTSASNNPSVLQGIFMRIAALASSPDLLHPENTLSQISLLVSSAQQQIQRTQQLSQEYEEDEDEDEESDYQGNYQPQPDYTQSQYTNGQSGYYPSTSYSSS
jgi:hypothetical protein